MATKKTATKEIKKSPAKKKSVAKKATPSPATFPGIESDATKTTLDMISSYLTEKHLSYIYDQLLVELDKAKGSAKNNYRKISQYIHNQAVLKQLVLPTTVKRGKVKALLPNQVEVIEQAPEASKTKTSKKATFNISNGKDVKNTAPGTTYSLATTTEFVPSIAASVDIAPFTDLLQKLMESEVKQITDKSISSLKDGYVKSVNLLKNGKTFKVLVIGTALGYIGDKYIDVNCRLAEEFLSPDMCLKQADDKPYQKAVGSFVGRPNKEWRFIRLLDYNKFLNKKVRYWAQDKFAKKDINSAAYTLRGDNIEISSTPKKK